MHMLNMSTLCRYSVGINSLKSVVRVDRPMKALYMHIQTPLKIMFREIALIKLTPSPCFLLQIFIMVHVT